ncbi:CHASE2 domain-containing protein [Aerosakkonemataceae cyanobacterium BLCC-F154]|uniref:CHASE2 domain-containing protein n=1 Tax=Floridaenema fluviatile BLCC-F154 TaxID=3153640 RepID=A0ABV4YK96_9CYAN
MIKQLAKNATKRGKNLKQQLLENRRVWISFSVVAACLISLRLMGLLQFGEWEALDQFFRLRPPQVVDQRILIVGIQEADIQRIGSWPIPDRNMAELIDKIRSLQPRAIGLDIYRDLPVPPGHTEWLETAQTTPNLVGIEQLSNNNSPGVEGPPLLKQQGRVGFNNVIVDPDGKVRRNLLYWHINDKPRISFALKLALSYLKAEKIQPHSANNKNRYLQLGEAVFHRFQPNDGSYVMADAGGYQILANFQGPAGSFRTVSMAQMLSGEVPPEWVRDRIVLIGSTAESLKDFFLTPYSTGLFIGGPKPISGIELQANFISQILNAAQGKTVLFQVWPEWLEISWILFWTWLGTILIWRSPSVKLSLIYLILAIFILFIISYLAFLAGWWLPFIPPMLGLVASAIAITALVAHLKEEFKRSKEFLQNLIDAIPDPIFVKDKQHRWIVLNQAYCRFIGYPLAKLLEKSDFDVFSNHEANIFWHQDELVFQSGNATENEEEFTNSQGITHHIATKRSLHKDPAGNIFLIGVIRDITERKHLEENLKRTAAELVRSNTELRLSEDRLRYLAYHDTLTGLPNRKLFHERLSQSIDWAHQNHQLVALLFLDLDGFKLINDTKGHDTGDLLLQTVGERLKRCLRSSDTVSRLGGDEFTVILPGIPSLPDIAKVADKILTTINQPFILQGHKIRISTSIGISVYPLNGENIETLIKNADAAMYSAKQLGKNNYTFS